MLHSVTKYFKQESPAWTQEAYRPRRIKYSICWPRWGPPPAGVPQAAPWPGLMGVEGTQGGAPSGRVPPHLDLARVPPSPVWTWQGYPPPPPPPGVDRQMAGWMDGQMRVKTYPSLVLRTRSVKIRNKWPARQTRYMHTAMIRKYSFHFSAAVDTVPQANVKSINWYIHLLHIKTIDFSAMGAEHHQRVRTCNFNWYHDP